MHSHWHLAFEYPCTKTDERNKRRIESNSDIAVLFVVFSAMF